MVNRKNRMVIGWLTGLVLLFLIIPVACLAATGGPDDFGYTWADQDEPGVDYDFIDISTTVTPVTQGDDTSSGGIDLEESFSFYGVDYNQLTMSTNGYLSTDPTDSGRDYSNDCPLPETPSHGGGARLYPLHDDLVSTGYVQHFAVCPRPSERNPGEGCTVFMWGDLRHYGNATEWGPMEVIIYHQSGDFVFQIGPGNPEQGSGSTTGIQNASATDGLTYACNTDDSVPDRTVVSFYNPLFPPSVPTLSEWGFILLLMSMLVVSVVTLRRQREC